MSQDGEFLHALFPDIPPGCIEVRVIKEGRGGEVFARTWHSGADDLLSALPRLRSIAVPRHAGVFYGVLPRSAAGRGKAEDILPGVAVWADLDFKRLAGGEEEARTTLAALPLPPTAVVASGHGLHVYYLLREPEDPSTLSRLAGRLAATLGGDRVHDPARILRLPGTLNLKDPAHPVEVRLEVWEPSRAYNPSDLDEMLPPMRVPAADPAPDPSLSAGSFIPGDTLPPRVTALIAKHARVRNLFEGRGKPDVDETGRALDTTSSGYDLSFVMSLVRHGLRDPLELAQALWHRPEDAARSKGVQYIARTVQRALTLVPEPEGGKEARAARTKVEPDFTVEGVRVFASNPPVYEVLVGGRALILSTAEILSPRRFEGRYVEAFRRIPILPRDPDDWRELVNGWLAAAETIDQPPEASPAEIVRQAIEQLVEDGPVGELPKDLDTGRAIELQGWRVFKLVPLLQQLQTGFPEVTAPSVSRDLHALGYQPRKIRWEGIEIRVWGRPLSAVRDTGDTNSPINAREKSEVG